ncbi:TPA: hypothetical protein QDB07_000871 [Burkholderia vietnamiensis]|uniref:hypothetical protein n=1 Tax=Burkholderia glumae TaxID=337 RepID=UPI0021504101|nr:hypothetical protein [Burkholderia glumae]HDR9033422.1 hypothetical protein [Burkholderia vietnamiensis]
MSDPHAPHLDAVHGSPAPEHAPGAAPQPETHTPTMQEMHWQRQLNLAAEDAPILVVEAWLLSGVKPNEQTVSAALRGADPLPALDSILAAAPNLVPSTLNRSRVMGDDGVLDLVLQHVSPSMLNERAQSPFPLWLEAFARTPDYHPSTECYDDAMAARIPTVLAKLAHGGADVEALRDSPYVRDARNVHGQVLRQALGIEPALALDGAVTGVQVVPFIDDGKFVQVQHEGPDERTSAWGVYVRDREHHANHVQDFDERAVAERFADELARAHAVKVEPYPWERLERLALEKDKPTLSMVAPALTSSSEEDQPVLRRTLGMGMSM